MGNQATRGVDSWGPVSVSLGISLSLTLAVVVGVKSVTLEGILVSLGSQMLSGSNLLGWGVVWDKSTVGMGNQATGGVDSWGPVGVSLSLTLAVVVGVKSSVWVVGVVQTKSVTLEGILVSLGSQMLSGSSLLGWGVVWDKGAIGMGNKSACGVDSWGPVRISLCHGRCDQREDSSNKGLHGNFEIYSCAFQSKFGTATPM